MKILITSRTTLGELDEHVKGWGLRLKITLSSNEVYEVTLIDHAKTFGAASGSPLYSVVQAAFDAYFAAKGLALAPPS